MRTLAIGDIHGCSTALRTLLDIVQPGPDDVLVTLGDYVDRGPDSKGVLDTLISLEKSTQLKPIIGNHEILFLEALNQRIDPEGWLRVGGKETIESYSPGIQTLAWNVVPAAHVDFLSQRCLRYYEDKANLFVHANANAYFSLADQSDDWLFWTRFDDVYPHTSGKRIICGHTAQKTGLPNLKSYAICLDTWAYGQGWLTCMDVEAETFVQVNNAGAVRHTSIRELTEPPTANTIRIPLPKT
ncbi:metallophosphoesterase family protein [Brevifollis gellanilyticus]|uniref:Serine/threonine protein phosphatase n=1 Tax=Brevifollis gellanilyticus TaxID=748831 RepID=A0A512MAK6_9BACT|nr:metallophosphoesterase family protein [Brevifollis gellanilyticus]GEP43775.1 serine/threonine protein phosphatase [Brevifollis gellanilyticus]